MLFKMNTLKKIETGEIKLAFRCWRKPTVKEGGKLTTAIGVLSIRTVERVARSSIKADDAKAAGFATRAELLRELSDRAGNVYRIEFRLAGKDPRQKLRQARLKSDELARLQERLDRMDRASSHGAWTEKVLEMIRQNPRMPARMLAEMLGMERDVLKRNVRKLKNLGLTNSHHPAGYSISARGDSYLQRRD